MGKVLFLATVFHHLEAFHIPFIEYLRREGHEVHAAGSPEMRPPDRLRQMGVKCVDIPFVRSPFAIGNLAAAKSVWNLLAREHYDLIHVHTPAAAFIGRLAAKIARQGRVLYTAHGFHFYKGASPMGCVYYLAEKLAARWTDGLVVMNQEDYSAGKLLGFTPDNLFRVRGVGVDLTRFTDISRESPVESLVDGLQLDGPVFTCVGELNRNKNQEFLLMAWQQYSAHEPGSLLIVGEGSHEGKLKELVTRFNVPRVHFLGFRSDVPGLLQRADVGVLTSRREGLPRCLLEMMAAGKPAIATNVRGNRDLVEDGVNGLLVELGDIAGLTTAMTTLARDESLRRAMGEAGLRKVQEYSLEKVLGQMAAIYGRYLPP